MRKMMKRSVAMVMSLLLVLGMINVSTYAGDSKMPDEAVEAREVEAVEVESSRLENITAEVQEEASEEDIYPAYADDEYVTIIVEMEEAPVMDYYSESDYAEPDEDTTVGEAVSDFLASDEAQEIAEEVMESQESVISEITDVVAAIPAAADDESGDAFEVENRWSTITNAIAVKVPYGALSAISEIAGVKRAYVEHVYSLPDDESVETTYDDPNYTYSLNMAGVTEAWAEGYTGLGMVVAVLDTGIDLNWGITDSTGTNYGITQVHEAFTEDSFVTDGTELYENLRWTSASMKSFVESTALNSNTNSDGDMIYWDNNALYKNLKVPYACDYADGDINVYNSNSSHGCHVSGTIAGYAESDEGEVLFSGVAPDAQILMMKVFGDEDSGAYESSIIMALEDSMKLGADVVNLSLGSDNGFSEDDTLQNDMFDRVEAAGVIIITSAGNSSDSDAYNNYGDETLASNPETSMMSSPAVYDSNLAVASIENDITVESYFTWVDEAGVTHEVSFTDYWSVAMKQKFSDGTYPIYYVSGTGTYNDYYNAGFRSYYGWGSKGINGIALVERGELSFEEKITNATQFVWSYTQGGTTVYENPVQAVIVYDNDPESEELITMSVGNTTLTSAFISGKDGAEIVEALQNNYQVYLTVSSVDKTIGSETAGQLSEFSSWGAGPGLELKPEITAPGGNIWSTVPDTTTLNDGEYTGSYEMMSGTSMAAPHMTGISALVRQYVQSSSDFRGMAHTETDDIVKQLMVSTAVPQTDANGVYYSPRLQGAGLVNAGAAVTTPAYITVEGQSIGKLELSDDPEREGEYDIAFTVNNISESEVTYEANVVLMRPDVETAESYYGTEASFMTDDDVVIKTVSLGNITVAANSSTDVSETVSLTAEEKAELDKLFVNGTYVEGYVILTDPSEVNPQIGLPMLAFYGDWTAAPIFDTSVWYVDADSDYDEEYGAFAEESTWGTSIVGSQIISGSQVIGYVNLGQNVFDSTTDEDGNAYTQYVYYDENFEISPDGNGYLDVIDDYVIYQLRDAKLIMIEVTDAETGEVYMRDGTSYMGKTIYDTSYAMALPYSAYGVLPTWDGTDLDGNVLPSGTKCIFTIKAYGDGEYPTTWSEEDGMDVTDFEAILDGTAVPTFNGHAMDMTGDTISFNVVVDTEAPKLENNAVSVYEVEEEDGTHVYMTGTVYDEDGSIANVEVYPYVVRSYVDGYGDPSYSETGIDYLNTFYTQNVYDAGTKTLTFTADVTEYVRENWSYAYESYTYQFAWTGDVLVSCGDYGANDRSYAISINTDEGIVLSQTSALLHITLDEEGNIAEGANFELSVLDNTGEEVEGEITRTSSNPDVATIDEYGHIEATGVGQTIITVAKGSSYAICIVAVEATTTEVIDFDLSIENFDSLTPDGQLTVKVTNLQPADVVIESKQWLVYESDDYAENYASGLVNVSQNSSDGLSGIIELNYNNCAALGVDEMPAGEGWLEVTLNGVTRTMTFSWEDLYKTATDDDLVSALSYTEQAVYVDLGETATLEAKYNNTSMHSVGEVALYTAVGAANYSQDNSTEASTGLVLDGQPYFNANSSWTGKIVNTEGYALPESIRVFTRYEDGYESELMNYSWRTNYSYDSQTGEITVNYAPTSNTATLVIRADGVVSESNPAGELSGTEWSVPDGLYGPFDWTITSGTGTGEEVTVTQTYGGDIYAYNYTPSEPGVSIVTATTKDGSYSLSFAVVCEPIVADTLDLSSHSLTMTQYDTFDTTEDGFAILSPEPTLEEDAQVSWYSFDESIVQVGEDGELIAVGAGDVYVKGYLTTDNTVTTYLTIHVDPMIWNVTFVDWNGDVLAEQTVQDGNSAVAPQDPSREGYTFTGWDVSFDEVKGDLTVTAQYEEIVIVDKSALQTAYNEGSALTASTYTADSWSNFNSALSAANTVLANEAATQTEVDAALAALNAAKAALVIASTEEPGTDTPGTEDTDTETPETEEPGTEGSTTEEPDSEPESEESVDKTELQQAADDSDLFTQTDYTEDSWDAYNQAVAAANTVLANPDATQEEVNAALEALNEAAAALVSVSTEPDGEETVDKTELQEAADVSVTLTEGDYTEDSWNDYLQAVEAANIVLADENATQEEVDAALEALNAAIIALVDVTPENSETENPGTEEPGTEDDADSEEDTDSEDDSSDKTAGDGTNSGAGKTDVNGDSPKTADFSLGQTVAYWMLILCGAMAVVIAGIRRREN